MVRVLVVDDEPDFVEFIREFVVQSGYEPLAAFSGPEALRLVKEQRPHIVLLDIRMPGMDGIEVLKAIREIDREVGVVMLTGVKDEETGRRALLLGAFDYLVKPIDLKYLERVLWYQVTAMTL
jgi:DNA-binding response OmpR family regulator